MSDRNVNSTQAERKEAAPVQAVHPFFLPSTSKRTNMAPGPDVRVPAPHDSAHSTKRQKKRHAFHKSKPTKIQSFFNVKTSRTETASVTREMEQLACETSVAAGIYVAAGVRNEAEAPPENGPRQDATDDLRSRGQQTTASTAVLRLPGIPAPYPAVDTHVPTPRYTRYSSTACAAAPGCCRRVSSQEIDAASSYDRLGNLQSLCMDFNYRGSAADKTSHTSNLPGLFSLKAPAIHVKAILGDVSSVIPEHVSFLEPVIDAIISSSPHSQTLNTQLLASRYHPKKVGHLLSNQRSAFQLRSWLEGMRIKWPSQTLDDKINSSTVYSGMTGSDKSHKNKFVSVYSAKRGGYSNISGSDNDENHPQPADNCDSDSSDDFIPSTVTKRRQYRKSGDMDDVIAWAKSNGTLSDVRDNLHRASRHRRSGSGYTSGSEMVTFSNVVLLQGLSGSCKTAAVYACAEECGFEVCEIHPGQRRSGKDVLDTLEDALRSHTIVAASKGASATPENAANQMLILVEQVDILFEQDQRLWPALRQLALKSRRPIVLTCNDISCIRWDIACFRHVFHFQRPKECVIVPYIFFLCLAEGVLVAPSGIHRACWTAECDINRILSSLEIATRYAALQSSAPATDNRDVPRCTEHSDAHLEGTIAWMTEPLSAQETPESRFSFWVDLVSSAQKAEDTDVWFKKWPDPPPQQTMGIDRTSKDSSVHLPAGHNRFFASSVPLAGSTLAESILDAQQLSDSRQCTVVPMAMPNDEHARHNSCVNGLTHLSLSGLEEIERTANSLDLLSFACATTGATEVHSESLYEPLYSYQTPMADGCLNVSYITLDADVLGSKNAELLANGFGVDRYGSTYIDDYLRQAAFKYLCQPHGSQSPADQAVLCQEAQGVSRPHGCHGADANKYRTTRELHQALECVGLATRHRILPLLAFETTSFLAKMVFWDWVHLKKVEAPAASNHEPQCAGGEHGYRIGTRRTRRNAYRMHIKSMPDSTRELLVSWMTFQTSINK